MTTKVQRQTVDLSKYPDLVVVYLGMRVNRIQGIKTLLGFGPRISSSVQAQPRFAHEVDAFRTPPAVVATIPARFGRHGVLARSIFSPRGNGGHL